MLIPLGLGKRYQHRTLAPPSAGEVFGTPIIGAVIHGSPGAPTHSGRPDETIIDDVDGGAMPSDAPATMSMRMLEPSKYPMHDCGMDIEVEHPTQGWQDDRIANTAFIDRRGHLAFREGVDPCAG